MSRRWVSTRFRMRNMISVRLDSDVARQAGKAARAAATAASTSSAEAKSTSRATSPVAGLNTGPRRPDVPATRAPPIQCGTASAVGAARCVCGSATWVIGRYLGAGVLACSREYQGSATGNTAG